MTPRELAQACIRESAPKLADIVTVVCTGCKKVSQKRFRYIVKCCRNRNDLYLCLKCSNQRIARDPTIRDRINATKKKNYRPRNLQERKEKFLAEAISVHNNKYDYSKMHYCRNNTKIEIICPNHGSFWQTPDTHRRGHGCMQCGLASSKSNQRQSKSSTLEAFVKRAEIVHNNKYDYSMPYVNAQTKIEIICPEHGPFWQTPNHHVHGTRPTGCPNCQSPISREHLKLQTRYNSTNVVCVENQYGILNNYEIDLWFPHHKVGIEINGCYWHGMHSWNEQSHNRLRLLHFNKAGEAEALAIQLLQFWDYEINQNFDLVVSMVDNKLNRSSRVFARNCQINHPSNRRLQEFFNRAHLGGYRTASVNIALVRTDEIMAALSLSHHEKHQWEIIRYACKPQTTVVGGFSRLLKHFICHYKPQEILTFADRRFSHGNVYNKFGFQRLGITKPNYFYSKGKQRFSRQQCQKHKLNRLLGDAFSPQMSETQNMLSAGFAKVYDAGHSKWLWTENYCDKR